MYTVYMLYIQYTVYMLYTDSVNVGIIKCTRKVEEHLKFVISYKHNTFSSEKHMF